MTTPPPADRPRRFDPAMLPILAAGLVLLAAVLWLFARPAPTTGPTAEARLTEEVAALRAELNRQAALERRVAGLEGMATRLAALEARPAPDLAPLREGTAAASGRAEAAERRAAALEERLAATARDLAPRSTLEELDTRLDRAETAAREAQMRDTALAERIEALGRDLAGREARLTERLDTLGRDARAATENAAAALGQRIGTAEAGLAARAQAAEAQAGRITALEGALASRAAALEATIQQRGAALEGALAQRGAALEGTLSTQAAALDALTGRVGALEGALPRLAALEGRSARAATIEALRTALDSGRPLGAALANLPDPPAPLARFATTAPPTDSALRLSFDEAARAGRTASEPPAGGTSVLDGAMNRLSGLVTVRRGEEVVFGDAAAAEIERARRALEAGDIEGALRLLTRLPAPAREAMRGWTSQAEALVAARAALRALPPG